MGKINAGITGPLFGKVGGVVGFNWKGINAIRAYAVPANPNTSAQQAERTKFSFIVSVAKLILATILQTYWDPFATAMSGWNLFTQKNRATVTGDGDYQNIIMAFGDLEQETITKAYYTAENGDIDIQWSPSGLGNGEDTDQSVGVIIDDENNIAFVCDDSGTRSQQESMFNIGAGRDLSHLHAYLFFFRGTGSDLMVSNSSYSEVISSE